tara:strand:- start:216 stop:425 length:210 start_codon:yes stop_codon:yes gene_type:complete
MTGLWLIGDAALASGAHLVHAVHVPHPADYEVDNYFKFQILNDAFATAWAAPREIARELVSRNRCRWLK